MFREGQQIGLYNLIRKLGKGGFGEVWLAERKSKFVTTKVAVKLPLDEQVDHEAIKQEAQLWEQASGHPNILPIIDADEYDGQIVIVSEYAPDGSLDEWLKRNGKMPIEKAVEITIKILDGLEFLHSRNIIHRDLKPANILLQGETPRLADFGISRALRTTATSQSSNVSGTFAYMPPEGFDGKRSVQTDVWSVGVNLYQFLTGVLPFPNKEPSALIAAIMMRDFEPLPANVPQNLQNVITKALAKQPENRYASAAAMREDLRRVLRGEAINAKANQQNAVPFANVDLQNVETETVIRPVTTTKSKPTNQSKKLTVWVLLSVLLVVGLFGLYEFNLLRNRTSDRNSEISNVANFSNSTNLNNLAATSKSMPNLPVQSPAREESKKTSTIEKLTSSANPNWLLDEFTVLDNSSNLMWTRKDFRTISGRFTNDWNDVMKWAKDMNNQRYAGYSDWQVASITEYRTIYKKPFYAETFESGNENYYWARNEVSSSVASYIDFHEGFAVSGDKQGQSNALTGEPFRFSARLVRKIK